MNIANTEHPLPADNHDAPEQDVDTVEEREWHDRQVAAARAAHVLIRQRRLKTLRAALKASECVNP